MTTITGYVISFREKDKMTDNSIGHEHYLEAERLSFDPGTAGRAQVHATLALTSAVASIALTLKESFDATAFDASIDADVSG